MELAIIQVSMYIRLSVDGKSLYFFISMSHTSWHLKIYLAAKSTECLTITRKLCYRKDYRAMRPIHAITWEPWKFSGLPDYAHGYYSQHFYGLLFGSTLWMFLQNLKSVALPVPEIIGGTQKIWAVPGYAHAPFSPKFLMSFYSDWPRKCTHQIWSP